MEKLIRGAKGLGLDLTLRQVKQFQIYYRELVSWNKRVNLTAIVDYDEVQVKHFLDSLTLVPVLNAALILRVLDVGSGAGLPGVPLKIVCPSISLTLLDSVAKKTSFLSYLVARLELDSVEILTERAENLAQKEGYREQFDLVLSRAVGTLPTLIELTLPFCKVGGIFVAQKKGSVGQELDQAATAIATLGGRLKEVKRVVLDEFIEERFLIIVEKVSPTPPRYPRRAGVPLRRPI